MFSLMSYSESLISQYNALCYFLQKKLFVEMSMSAHDRYFIIKQQTHIEQLI